MCGGVRFNATKVRLLRALGLVDNTKPNGRPLVPRPTTGDRAAIIALFSRKTA